MKKFLLFLMTLMVLAAPQVIRAQSELTVHDGTTTNGNVPLYGWYADAYLKCEMVYPAAELSGMNGGSINSMTFYASQTSVDWGNAEFQVFVAEVSDATISDFAGPGTVVYEGALSIANGMMTVEFDAPYTYNGGNLLVGVYETTIGSYVTSTWYGESVTGASVSGYSYSDLASISATQRDFLPKTTFTYQGSGPVCEKPSTLDVTDITGYDATCTWTSEVGNYTFEYKKASASDWTVVTGLTANTYPLSNLEPFTAYNTRVKAVCGTDFESGYKTANFTTLDVCPDGMVCIGEGTATNSMLPTYNFYNYSLTQQIYTVDELGDPAAILGVDIYSVGTVTRNLEIYMVATEKDTFADGDDWIAATTSDLVFSGEVTFAANSWNTMEFDNPFVYNGQSNVALIVRDMTGSYVSGINFFVFDATGQAIRAYRDASEYDIASPGVTGSVLNVKNRVRFAMGEPPACPKPTGVTVNYTGGTEATISWTSDASAWTIQYYDDSQEYEIEVTENPYTLTGLQLSTTYGVMIQADCGSEMSEWTNAVEFTTDDCMPEDMIIVNYELADSYGDGWNGNYILVVDENCNIAETLTIESGSSATGTVKVCGTVAQFMWYMSGSSTYPSETSWSFTDANGNELFAGAGNSSMATFDVLYTIDLNPYAMPTDLEAVEVGPHTATLSWTENGTATAWQIGFYDENDSLVDIVDANSNPFTLTGLTPVTEYYVRVRATGANGTSLWPCLGVDFTTDVPCPAPTELVVNPFVTSADISWNGFADAYDLEWAVMPAAETRDGGIWLQYDDGTVVTNVGNSTVYEWTWAAMYPASMLEGNGLLSKVAFYETSYYSDGDPITINIYSGGDSEPETLVYTENVTCTGTVGIHEVELSSFVNIDPAQNLWITLTSTTIDRPMAMSAVDEANGRWVDNGGWIDIGSALSSVAAYTFMIRGYVEPSFDPSELEWTSVSGVTSPYTIEGLDAETTYIVRVKANCGGEDGESTWSQTSFTTKNACDLPNSLVSEVNGTTATLSWNGYQESFNLYYRQQVADPTVPATIILEANDVWEDGSGYMMLLDADTTAFGTLWNTNHYIFVDGEQYSGGDIPASYFDEFEYKIPTGANGSLDDSINIVVTGSVTLQIPAGTYDYVIFNPTPGDRFYIAADNGEVPCAGDNFVFEPGVTYHFTMQRFGTGDGAAFEIIRPMSDWVVVENVTTPYELTGLEPETYYEWYVEGINAECTGALVSETANFTTGELAPQTIALNNGTNWVSFNVEITLNDLKAALIEAAPNTTIKIIGQNNYTTYNPSNHRWLGTLSWDLSKMYKIQVTTDCEISLEGTPIDPADYTVTIVNGNNYLGFPFNQNMTLTNAFAGFAANGDKVLSQTGYATYNRGRWQGTTLTQLQPGKGYIYKSAASESRPFVFPNSAR